MNYKDKGYCEESEKTEIYFVRHAEPNYNNHNDEERELSERGMKDRELVTKFLSDKNIDVVLSSPYKRSVDTVQDFANKYDFEVRKIFDFRERKVDSVWIEDFEDFSKKQWEDFNYKLSDGETLKSVQERNVQALYNLLEEYQGKNIVIGSHGTALSTIINYFDSSFKYEDFKRIKLLMPWIVQFTFSSDKLIKIKEYNLFKNI